MSWSLHLMKLVLEDGDLAATSRAAVQSLSGLVVGRNVHVDAQDDALAARYDPGLMQRVVANLVGNALKFTPEDGTVTIRVRAAGGRPRLEVGDAGPGIPEEYREKVFEKFGQIEGRTDKKVASTGLGLTFCKLAVEAHGGVMGVESVVGEGSTFWFELPAP
jgi:signal transduction histidine kinase